MGFGGKLWRVTWIAFLAFIVLSFCQVLLFKFVNPPLTPLMVMRYFQQKKDPNREVRFERDYVSIDDISPNLINVVNASENRGYFMYDNGIVFCCLKSAYLSNKVNTNTLRGGSVITQQTAKNCFTYHKRNMYRKAKETYYTFLINTFWGKKRIMECYLNIIEFGDGIYGCEAASQYYFHHSAKDLTNDEALMLGATIPSPLHGNPDHPNKVYSDVLVRLPSRLKKAEPIVWDADPDTLDPEKVKEGNRGLFVFAKWVILHEWKQLVNKS